MSNEQALSIIKQACASIQANLQAHEQIQAAIRTLERAVQTTETNEE